MSRNRLMLLLASVAAVVLAAGGFFLGVQPQLDRASAARAERTSVEASNAKTRAELERLREQAKSLPKMRSELAALRASVPPTASAAGLISQVNATADSAGVKVASITVGDAQAYTPPAAAASGAAEQNSATDGPSGSSTPTPSASPSTPAATAPPVTTNSSITASNFSVIPVSVSVTGEFAQALGFVKGVQSNPRLFLIDSISSSLAENASSDAASDASAPTWTFSGSVYVLADTGEGAGPGASSTATPSPAANG